MELHKKSGCGVLHCTPGIHPHEDVADDYAEDDGNDQYGAPNLVMVLNPRSFIM